MKDYSVHIKSKDSANIFINGSFVGLIDNNEIFSIDLRVYTTSLIITKEPLSVNADILLPYTVKIDFKEKVNSNNPLAVVVPFKNSEYDILLENCQIKSRQQLEKVYDEYVENYNIVVVNDGKSYINIYDMNNVKLSLITEELNQIHAEKKDNTIILKAYTRNNKYYLICINSDTFEVIFNEEIEKFEQLATEIKAIEFLNDIAKHGKVTTIYYQNASTSTYYVYLKESNNLVKSSRLIPYAFLEAIKINNFDLAKEYLSDNLSKQTDNGHLQSYFQNFDKIYYNTYNFNNNTINYTLSTSDKTKYKSFDFTIFDNKIDEIEEIEF